MEDDSFFRVGSNFQTGLNPITNEFIFSSGEIFQLPKISLNEMIDKIEFLERKIKELERFKLDTILEPIFYPILIDIIWKYYS